ncbi:MAG TPA: metallophosphoesterase [Xanthobacteraceae bacterium]
MKLLSLMTAAGIAALVFSSGAAQSKILAQWVQLGPDGTISARAITDEAACPAVTFDGTPVPMMTRSAPEQTFGNVKEATFPVRGCEADVPSGTRASLLDDKPLPVPKPDPQRIVVFGDTGCRLDRNVAQNCDDPDKWPFPKIASLAAAVRPDLVIHVGDYLYRERCPADGSRCPGGVAGYGYAPWEADFFGPAAPLLAAAPWVMLRGNHEDCSRAGEGWFRFLDRAPMEGACRDLTGIFVARQGDFAVVVVDGAKADDPKDSAAFAALADLLQRQLADVADKVPGEAWLATHRPINAMAINFSGVPTVNNKVQEAGLGPVMPAGVRMEIAGHVHFFQAVDFGGRRPPTLVVGTGGDVLERMSPMSVAGSDINGLAVVNSVTRLGFAYMVWNRDGPDWSGTLYDVDGNSIYHCRLSGRSLGCSS